MKQLDEKVEQLKNQALDLLKSAGYQIHETVGVRVDPTLPYMGYTTEENCQTVIVVSGDGLKSGMALNLLIHELSHAYRLENHHPSHNSQLLDAITNWVLNGKLLQEYQTETIQALINHLQDLYADDISFAVFAKNAQQENLNEFFLNWIKEPKKGFSEEAIWANVSTVISAAFAQANLERHHVKDTDGKVATAIASLLEKMPERYSDKYAFFKDFMINLSDPVSDKEFESLLIKYLSEFLKLTKAR